MSNIVNINMDGTWATVKTAFETMGFTVTEDNGVYTCYYAADTNHKIYCKLTNTSGTVFTIYFYKSNNQSMYNFTNWNYSVSNKINYLKIGDSIIFGNCSVDKPFVFQELIVAPFSSSDDWQYFQGGNGNWYNGRTETNFTWNFDVLKPSNAAVQIIKVYDSSRFVDNIYYTTISPSVPAYNSGYPNAIYATIGEDLFILLNMKASASGSCVALKIPSSS